MPSANYHPGRPRLARQAPGYSYAIRLRGATAITALVIAGCGSSIANNGTGSAPAPSTTTATQSIPTQAHPQVVEPTAGQAGSTRTAQHSDPPAAPPGNAPRAP